MEENIKIPLNDKKYVHGTLRGSLKNPLIIMVHGLGGFKDEHIHFNGSKFFENRGYSAFRFNLYGHEKNARKLQDCTLSVHAGDLDTVIDYFRKHNAKKIYVVGHSYGGPTILLSGKKDFDKIVLWDPAISPKDIVEKEFKRLQGTDMFYVDWGLAVIMGKKMASEDKSIDPLKLLKNIHVPIKFIFAGKGEQTPKQREIYFDAANEPKETITINEATHNFHEEGIEEKLFNETLSWFDRK